MVQASWSRRATGYALRIILPWSLLFQLLGTVFLGRSWPSGTDGQIVGAGALTIVMLASVLSTVDGQPWAYQILSMAVCTDDGEPATRARIAVREAAHALDIASLGIGFLWPLWNRDRKTFADVLTGTRIMRCEHELSRSKHSDK